ncbi:chromosome partition protein MukE [Klebsiella variicola subsp. variicola]|nr:chromosome partition protein MukE [Klebsiella variicola subsp. variicola]
MKARLLKLVNNRSTGSDLDRQKLPGKMRAPTACAAWGWCGLWAMTAASFALPNRYSALAPMCAPATDPREAQRRLIRDGKRWLWKITCKLNDENEGNQPDGGEREE